MLQKFIGLHFVRNKVKMGIERLQCMNIKLVLKDKVNNLNEVFRLIFHIKEIFIFSILTYYPLLPSIFS